MRKYYFVIVMIFSDLTNSFGQLYQVPIVQKVENSDYIIEGEVINQDQIIIGGMPYTVNLIKVQKVLKGVALESEVVKVLTLGGNINGEKIFSQHTLRLRLNEKGIFFLAQHHINEVKSEYYIVYSERQGYYKENYNGSIVELVSQFSKYQGRNSFYKEIGYNYDKIAIQSEYNPDNCLAYRIEPIGNSAQVSGSGTEIRFRLYVKSNVPVKLKSTSIAINYNTSWFGSNIVASGNTDFINGIFNSSYSLNLADITSDVFNIELNSNAAISGLQIINSSEILIGTFGFKIANISIGDPINIENTQYETKFYDLNNEQQTSECGRIEVQGFACDVEITNIEVIKSAGTENILEITGTGFIHDSALPSDAWCGLPNKEHRVKFTDVNGNWIAPLEGDYLEWTATKIRVKVPTEGYVDNSFNRSDFGLDEIAATGKIRVCVNDGLFKCSCYDTSEPTDNSNSGKLHVPFAIPSLDLDPNATCKHAKSARLFSRANNYEISFNIDALPSNAKSAFIRALNTWRCAIDINYTLISTGNVVSLGTTSSGQLGLTFVGIASCSDGENTIDPKSITFDASANWHFDITNPPLEKHDFESVALHEIGHAIGLLHTSNSGNIMFPSIGPGISKRNLTTDDLDGGIFNQNKSLNPIMCGTKLNTLSGACNLSTSTNQVFLQNDIHLHPNPLSNVLNIESEQNIKKIQIVDSKGNIILEEDEVNSQKYSKDINNLNNGLYIIIISNFNNTSSKKFLKI